MPVDKYGHTDTGVSQRVIVGGVTLSQVNATFLRLDGANPATGNLNMGGHAIKGLPTTNTSTARGDEALSWAQAIDLITNHEDSPYNDNHLTNKKYVDEQTALKVSKTGGVITGTISMNQNNISDLKDPVFAQDAATKNYVDDTRSGVAGDTLLLHSSSESTAYIKLGCKDIRLQGQSFILYLGDDDNRITFTKSIPVILQTTEGFRVRINNETVIEMNESIGNFGPPAARINVYKNIYMYDAYISGLSDPLGDTDAATKRYVDTTTFGPTFNVYNSTDQVITVPLIDTKVSFNTVSFDTDESFNPAFSRFSPRRAGLYLVSVYIEFKNNLNRTWGNVKVYKNGGPLTQIAGGGGTGASHNNATGSTIIKLTDALDFLEIYVNVSENMSIIARSFAATFIHP